MKSMPKPLKYFIFLLVLGIITGTLLALVNSITAPIIAERAEREAQEALQEYFDYERYEEVTGNYDNLNKGIDKIYFAYNSETLAAVIYQTTFNGYGGGVTSLVGINYDTNEFLDVQVIAASQETKNIGSKVIGYDFTIKNESIDSYTFEIIAGATYSSNAVEEGIKAAREHFIAYLRPLDN